MEGGFCAGEPFLSDSSYSFFQELVDVDSLAEGDGSWSFS